MTAFGVFRHRILYLYIIIVIFVVSLYLHRNNNSLQSITRKTPPTSTTSLTTKSTEAICVREVLEALKLPLSRRDYSLQTLEYPLDLTLLSHPCQAFLIPQKITDKRLKELKCFFPEYLIRLDPFDKERIHSVMLLIRGYFDRANIPITMTYGTAIGSWRMHGRIPYDHDFDFFVLRRQMSKAVELMKKMQKIHPHLLQAYYFEHNLWRFNIKRKDGSSLTLVDVFFHKLRDNNSVIEQFPPPPTIEARTLFPLVQRPFEGVLFKTWRNMKHYFRQVYSKDADIKCKPTPWMVSYFYKNNCTVNVVNCSELNYFFNFARRWEQEDGKLVEVLFNRSHAISVFYSPDGV